MVHLQAIRRQKCASKDNLRLQAVSLKDSPSTHIVSNFCRYVLAAHLIAFMLSLVGHAILVLSAWTKPFSPSHFETASASNGRKVRLKFGKVLVGPARRLLPASVHLRLWWCLWCFKSLIREGGKKYRQKGDGTSNDSGPNVELGLDGNKVKNDKRDLPPETLSSLSCRSLIDFSCFRNFWNCLVIFIFLPIQNEWPLSGRIDGEKFYYLALSCCLVCVMSELGRV